MKIINLTESSSVYTSNVYLVLGSWNSLSDINTLVDVGRDLNILETLNNTSTGVGKKRVEQVVLTHSHYDHTGILKQVREKFRPVVYSFSKCLEQVDNYLYDGQMLKLGDRSFEIIHIPGHSHDSVCFFCEEEGILFAGDTPLVIHQQGDTYHQDFVEGLEKIVSHDVKAIYFGHGAPITEKCNQILERSFEKVRNSFII